MTDNYVVALYVSIADLLTNLTNNDVSAEKFAYNWSHFYRILRDNVP